MSASSHALPATPFFPPDVFADSTKLVMTTPTQAGVLKEYFKKARTEKESADKVERILITNYVLVEKLSFQFSKIDINCLLKIFDNPNIKICNSIIQLIGYYQEIQDATDFIQLKLNFVNILRPCYFYVAPPLKNRAIINKLLTDTIAVSNYNAQEIEKLVNSSPVLAVVQSASVKVGRCLAELAMKMNAMTGTPKDPKAALENKKKFEEALKAFDAAVGEMILMIGKNSAEFKLFKENLGVYLDMMGIEQRKLKQQLGLLVKQG